ncbi:MAG: thioredoxin [Actinomycetaceae bacterium]|nr:thioredoxin [Actinomycetaceae bacterium]
MAEQIDDLNFDDKVLKADKPVLVDFWAAWCGPCRQMGPVIDEIAKEMEGTADVYKLNIDENPFLARKFGISSIPSFGVFNKGELVQMLVGARPKKSLMDPLKELAN